MSGGHLKLRHTTISAASIGFFDGVLLEIFIELVELAE
jgi:hypothetical protein